MNTHVFYIYILFVYSQTLTTIETDSNAQLHSPKKSICGQNDAEEMCEELFSTSLKIQCFYKKNITSCDEPMFHGTIAKLECKDSYHHDSIPYNEIRCANGKWNDRLFNCEPDCGKRATKATPLAINAVDVEFGDFPWHIGLYSKDKIGKETKLHYKCGGSIISPKLVITAAHCFLNLDSWRYQVAAGKVYRKYNHKRDRHAQYRDIVDIRISRKYDGQFNGFTADIAILVLRDVFILSNLIQPICIDFHSRSGEIGVHRLGEVAGWGQTAEVGNLSEYLQYLTLPLKNYQECKENVPEDFLPYVTFDKICAGFTNGTSVCTGDSGGGLVSKNINRNNEKLYYLIGIVSTSPFKNDSCDSFKYTTFTNIALHIDWINETMYRYEAWTPFDYGCKLPEAPTFGNYTVSNYIPDERTLTSGSLVPQYTKLTYFCSEGYALHGDQIVTCKEKQWSVNNLLPQCFRKCPILESSDHEIEYSLNSVDGFLLHETQAIVRCFDSNYELEAPGYNQTTCRDGEWTRPLLNCMPVCGISRKSDRFTQNDTYAYPGEYPWIVGIYFIANSSYNHMESSGAIISPFIVVSSPDDDFVEGATYLVVAGNTHYAFKNHLNDMTQQSFVHRIMHLNTFDTRVPTRSHYIFILKKPLKMTPFVRPICLSSSNTIPTDENTVGELPVWIKNDDNLRIVKFKLYQPTLELTSTIAVNSSTQSSVFAVPVSNPELGTRYFLIGYGVFYRGSVYILRNKRSNVISEVVQKYNIKVDEMSECTIPNTPTHGKRIDTSHYPGEIVPATTAIKYECELSSYDRYSSKENICKNGSWTLPHRERVCFVCGTSGRMNNSQIISPFENYYTANHKDFPWHVGIYDKKKVQSKVPELVCSGNIISSKLVLTHLFCFRDNIRTAFDKNKFAIGAGKLYSDWNNPLDIQAQYVDIDNLIFDGRYWYLIIAVLKEHLHITSFVLPVCFNVRRTILDLGNTPDEIPIWSEDKEDGKDLKFLRFPGKKQIREIRFSNSSFPCEHYVRSIFDTKIIGSGVVTQVRINNEQRTVLTSLVADFKCSLEMITLYNLYEDIHWLISIIQNNKV